MRVKSVMNKVVGIEEDTTIRRAASIMSDRNIGSLVVLKKDALTGIITENDIVKAASKRILDSKVSKVMSKNVETVSSSESIKNAAIIMSKSKIKRLPVVDKGKLVGIITATDIIANSSLLNEEFFFD